MAGGGKRFSGGTKLAVWSAAALLAAVLLMLAGAMREKSPAREELLSLVKAQSGGMRQAAPERPDGRPAAVSDDGAPEAPPVQQETEAEVTLAVGGAVSVPRAVRECAQEAGRYDFSTVFMGIGNAFSGADLALVTLESLTAPMLPYDGQNAPPEILDALRASGVGLVSVATEHMLDRGYEALDHTLLELTTKGLDAVGVRRDGLPGTMIGVGGIRIALLGYTYGLSEEGAEKTKADQRGAAPVLSEDVAAADIAAARANGADVVAVFPHWGVKNSKETPESIRRTAVRLAEAGADLIAGTHPNVVQGAEKLRVRRADGLTYDSWVLYSSGSLLTDARAEENSAGAVFRIRFVRRTGSREVLIGDPEVIPVYIARQAEDGQTSFRIVEAENEAALQVLVQSERVSAARAAQIVREAAGIPKEAP